MIWQTWRQQRSAAVVAMLLLAGLAAALIVVGNIARDRARAVGAPGCATSSACDNAFSALHNDFHSIPPFIAALVAIPLLAGVFWAAPLISREYEAGTHRLAWTQSVSPLRWMLTKIALVFGVLVAAALGLGLLTSWTLDPLINAFGGRYNTVWYDTQGIVPAACMLFALAVGVATSALFRRTIPAMAVTLVAYAAARIPVHFVRMDFIGMTTRTFTTPMSTLLAQPLGAPPDAFAAQLSAGDWVHTTTLADSTGHVVEPFAVNLAVLQQYCPALPSRGPIPQSILQTCRARLDGMTLRETVQYQPASHYWLIQAVEAAIFIGAAAALVTIAVLAVTRRRAV
jgi:hypothetical protein